MRSPSQVPARRSGALVCAVLCMALAGRPCAAATAVIVHPSTPVENLSFADIQRLFLGDKQYWNSSMPVVLILRAPAARERSITLNRIYRMTESQFKQYWIARIFRAEATSTPKVVYSNQTINELVAGIPGAIALVREEDVQPGVKVIRVDGALPGEPKYPLN